MIYYYYDVSDVGLVWRCFKWDIIIFFFEEEKGDEVVVVVEEEE